MKLSRCYCLLVAWMLVWPPPPASASTTPANWRGIAVLSSSIGQDVAPEEVVTVAKACRLNLVVIDFAWITYHWPRTTDAAVRLTEQLQQDGITVVLMYRPRTLHPGEAKVHYLADERGQIPRSHNDLDFGHDDSVDWGAEWGTKLLHRFPAVTRLIVYNLRGEQSATGAFLNRCSSSWRKVRPDVEIGHVGPDDVHAESVDWMLPFMTVQRDDRGSVHAARQARQIARLRDEHTRLTVVPMLKIDWASQTNNSTSDVIDAIAACESYQTGFVLWHYEHVFKNADTYNARQIVTALGGAWSDVGDLLVAEAANTPDSGNSAKSTTEISANSKGGSRAPDLPFPTPQAEFEKLPWPHQPPDATPDQIAELNDKVWIINDNPLYQADENGRWRYFHGGLDIVLENGTPIYAMKDGWVKAIRASTVTVADAADDAAAYGWEYTHLADFQVDVGEHVKRGTMLGRVKFHGLPHTHLTKVYSNGAYWGAWTYICYPNAHFDYPDTEPPIIHAPFHFFPNESDDEIVADESGRIVLSGKVDIVVGMREAGEYAHSRDNGFGDRLGVTRVEYEIQQIGSDTASELRKSFDFEKLRIKAGFDFAAARFGTEQTRLVYKHWKLFEPERSSGNKNFSYYIVTNSPPDEAPANLSPELAANCWDTAAVAANGELKYPNGPYEITVRAYDFAGHVAEQSVEMDVSN